MITHTHTQVQIFETLGSPINGYMSTLILGMAQLSGGVLGLTLIHWTGKRPLALISTLGSSLCFFVVAGYAYVKQLYVVETLSVSWIPLMFLNTAAFMTHVCIRLLPWMLIGEVGIVFIMKIRENNSDIINMTII